MANVSTDAVRTAITEAKGLLQRLRDDADHTYRAEVIDALEVRLELRDIFLQATECPQYIKEPDLAQIPWQQGISILPVLKSTHHLCKPVDDSFSAKLQRKLASTIPPTWFAIPTVDERSSTLTAKAISHCGMGRVRAVSEEGRIVRGMMPTMFVSKRPCVT